MGSGCPAAALVEFTGAVISGTVFNDLNRDNSYEPGELGLGSIPVSLYSGDTRVKATLTDSQGRYTFTGLTGGVYRLAQSPRQQFAFSASGVLTVTIPPFALVGSQNFGNYAAAGIVGQTWNDGDQDGRLIQGKRRYLGCRQRPANMETWQPAT